MSHMIETWQLAQRQGLPLESKVFFSKKRIREFYEHYEGNVYVSFSGGKDSLVLLHMVRSIYPDVPAVFIDTGLEFPEVREYVKTIPNVEWLRPNLSFDKVIKKYGYPVIGKDTSQKLYEIRNTTSESLKLRRMGRGSGSLVKKWGYLIFAPFKISHMCCNVLKKNPVYLYEKRTGRHGFIGTMACESRLRIQAYLARGCNVFTGRGLSTPLSIWLEEDIWGYIRENGLEYCKIYDMGISRTGCVFCLFGGHLDRFAKFDLLKKTHPEMYKYCMEKLGLRKIIDYIIGDLPEIEDFSDEV